MPNLVSYRGKWYPAKEEIGLVNKSDRTIKYNGETIQPGQPFIYKGADREAIKMLNEAGQEFLGTDFTSDPEFLQAVRNMGFSSGKEGVKEYLEMIGYDEEKDEKLFKERASVVKRHELPRRVKEIKQIGGGKDTTGNKENDIIGGFGDEKVRPASELELSKKGA